MIRALLIGMALALSGPAMAQEKKEVKKPTPQQERMADCNKQASAKQLKGDERKNFM